MFIALLEDENNSVILTDFDVQTQENTPEFYKNEYFCLSSGNAIKYAPFLPFEF